MNDPALCPCGRALHYSDSHLENLIRDLIARLGPDVPITIGKRAWMVSRHYIALHGIRGTDLAQVADRLGFTELFVCPECGLLSHNRNDFINRYCGRCQAYFPAPEG